MASSLFDVHASCFSSFRCGHHQFFVLLPCFLYCPWSALCCWNQNCSKLAFLYLARKHDKQLQFRKYVVCKKCHRIYHLSDCVEGYGRRQSKVCCFRRFPSHPQPSRRQPCGVKLLKTVEMVSGRTFFYPFLTYCYLSLEVSFQSLLHRRGFFHLCEQWKQREVNCEVLKDVYDGNIWKEFICYNGHPFLSEQGNFAVMMNMDFSSLTSMCSTLLGQSTSL